MQAPTLPLSLPISFTARFGYPAIDRRIIVTFAPHSLSNDEMFTIMPAIDNVIWEALTTRQVEFCESFGSARRFAREVTLLSAIDNSSTDGYDALGALVGENNTAAVFLNAPYEEQRGWTWIAGAPLLQMICEDDRPAREAETSRPKMVKLGLPDSAEMIELTTLTKPGPFGPRTHELGNYMGIREGGRLAAMAGERLKVPGFTEVSAVCTHPDFLGKGYAGALMKEIMRGIRHRGETPFLHVRGDNGRAIALYERLGFRIRHRGHFAVLRRETQAKAS